MNIVKVQYLNNGGLSGREYTYFSEDAGSIGCEGG